MGIYVYVIGGNWLNSNEWPANENLNPKNGIKQNDNNKRNWTKKTKLIWTKNLKCKT